MRWLYWVSIPTVEKKKKKKKNIEIASNKFCAKYQILFGGSVGCMPSFYKSLAFILL